MRHVIHGITYDFFETGTEGIVWSILDVRSLPRENTERYAGYWGLVTLHNDDWLRIWDDDYETLLLDSNDMPDGLTGINPNAAAPREPFVIRDESYMSKKQWWELFQGKPAMLVTDREPWVVGKFPIEGYQGIQDFSNHRNQQTDKYVYVYSDGSLKWPYTADTEIAHPEIPGIPWAGERTKSLRLIDWLEEKRKKEQG